MRQHSPPPASREELESELQHEQARYAARAGTKREQALRGRRIAELHSRLLRMPRENPPMTDEELLTKLRKGASLKTFQNAQRAFALVGASMTALPKPRKGYIAATPEHGTFVVEAPPGYKKLPDYAYSYAIRLHVPKEQEAGARAFQEWLKAAASAKLGKQTVEEERGPDGEARARDYKTDFTIRTCPVCFRDIKATKGAMADHGYTVQWHSRQGKCPGVRAKPWEVSPAGTAKFLARMIEHYEQLRRSYDTIGTDGRSLFVENWRDKKMVEILPNDDRYPRVVEEKKSKIASEMRMLAGDRFGGIPWYRMAIREWTPGSASAPAVGAPRGTPTVADSHGLTPPPVEKRWNPKKSVEALWGRPWGDRPAYLTPDGVEVWMRRKGQKVRFFDAAGAQIGPEQRNVGPAIAAATAAGWRHLNPAGSMSEEISHLRRKGYPQRRAVAAALSMERRGAFQRNPDTDPLARLLLGRGQHAGIGAETGPKSSPRDGIAKYSSPHGSVRYVYYVSGEPVSALQIVHAPGRVTTIANVYTVPDARRKGYAAKLLVRARKDFGTIEHSDHLSDDGAAWKGKVGNMRTRRSWRNQDKLFKQLFKPAEGPRVEPKRPAHLSMTDAEIDKTYFTFGKADRTRMKKEAAVERQREHVRAVLAAETKSNPGPDDPATSRFYVRGRDGNMHAVWEISDHAYQAMKGVHAPWIAEISPMQYAGMSKRAKAQYDEKRGREWQASSDVKDEWRDLVVEAGKLGLYDPKTLTEPARGVYWGGVAAAKEAALSVARGDARVENADVSSLAKGDIVFSIMASGYVVITKVSAKSARGDRLGNASEHGRDMKLQRGALEWLSYRDLEAAVASGASTTAELKAIAQTKGETKSNPKGSYSGQQGLPGRMGLPLDVKQHDVWAVWDALSSDYDRPSTVPDLAKQTGLSERVVRLILEKSGDVFEMDGGTWLHADAFEQRRSNPYGSHRGVRYYQTAGTYRIIGDEGPPFRRKQDMLEAINRMVDHGDHALQRAVANPRRPVRRNVSFLHAPYERREPFVLQEGPPPRQPSYADAMAGVQRAIDGALREEIAVYGQTSGQFGWQTKTEPTVRLSGPLKAIASNPAKLSESFTAALLHFLTWQQQHIEQTFPSSRNTVGYDLGGKYAKVWRSDGTMLGDHPNRSVLFFVDTTDGTIWKPDGWKKKSNTRVGNVYTWTHEPPSKHWVGGVGPKTQHNPTSTAGFVFGKEGTYDGRKKFEVKIEGAAWDAPKVEVQQHWPMSKHGATKGTRLGPNDEWNVRGEKGYHDYTQIAQRVPRAQAKKLAMAWLSEQRAAQPELFSEGVYGKRTNSAVKMTADKLERVMKLVERHPGSSLGELSTLTVYGRPTLEAALRVLAEEGRITRARTTPHRFTYTATKGNRAKRKNTALAKAPKTRAVKHAANWYKKAHWSIPATKAIHVDDPDLPAALTVMGTLTSITVRDKGEEIELDFTRYSPKCHLAFDPRKSRKLYNILSSAAEADVARRLITKDGTWYRLNDAQREFTDGRQKRYPFKKNLEVQLLGKIRRVLYFTNKKEDAASKGQGGVATYDHAVGEETHRYPLLGVDRSGRLWWVGGAYTVIAGGIKD